MTSNVVSIRDDIEAHHNEPNPEIIEMAEGILTMAKSGELQALAYVSVRVDKQVGTAWEYSQGYHDHMATGIYTLFSRLGIAMAVDE